MIEITLRRRHQNDQGAIHARLMASHTPSPSKLPRRIRSTGSQNICAVHSEIPARCAKTDFQHLVARLYAGKTLWFAQSLALESLVGQRDMPKISMV